MDSNAAEHRDAVQIEEVYRAEAEHCQRELKEDRNRLEQMETLFAYGAEDPLRMMIDTIPRLNGFPIQIPSLHERVDDIPLLVEYLIERYAKKAGKKIRNIRR